jgi:hypothetical protein
LQAGERESAGRMAALRSQALSWRPSCRQPSLAGLPPPCPFRIVEIVLLMPSRRSLRFLAKGHICCRKVPALALQPEQAGSRVPEQAAGLSFLGSRLPSGAPVLRFPSCSPLLPVLRSPSCSLMLPLLPYVALAPDSSNAFAFNHNPALNIFNPLSHTIVNPPCLKC